MIRAISIFALTLGAVGCGSSPPSTNRGNASGGASSGGTTTAGGTSGSGGSSGSVVNVETGLPPLPGMTNVSARVVHDNVDVTFDPVDDARDYRVYELPKNEDITADASGSLTIKNAIYRCAGDRQASAALADNEPDYQGPSVRTLVDNQNVEGYTRTLTDATLGYVYVTPGAGRVPVYAMADPAKNADVECDYLGNFSRWKESRPKIYVTSETERATLLAQNWRDDGIVFYAPGPAEAGIRSLYTKALVTDTNNNLSTRFYYVDGAEAAVRGPGDTAFQVLTAPSGTETQALMRVFYRGFCSLAHDELTVGKSRFERARHQGDQQPVYDLHWAGLTAETTLVVEALAEGCPYPGFFAAESKPARDIYPAWLTLDELRAASASGEVYINGQHEAGNKPRPIARAFLKVSPGAKPDLDWFEGFGADSQLGTLSDVACGVVGGDPSGCWTDFGKVSDSLDANFMLVEGDRWAMAPVLGELWVSFGDIAADVNGKFRMTPKVKSQLAADTFLRATMTVDTFTTGRRYPQIIISDQDIPVQVNMEKGYALVLQTFAGWPNLFQLEVCDHQFWDVNAQCPAYDFRHVADPADPATILRSAASPEVGEQSGMDRSTILDVYASSKRAYLFLDGQPFGCADLPAATVPAGPVTVTFGDVLYHSDADLLFKYTTDALHRSTRRHYDNLGFKAGVAAPAWDESRFPCASPATMK